MNWHICNDCRWKFDSDDHKQCPKCGQPVPDRPTMVQQWNSTLKANPKKKPKRSPIKYKKKDSGLKDAMIKRAEQEIEEAQKEGRAIRCQHCGRPISDIKYENISHREPRSTAPDKRTDVENMDFLCGPTDYWGEVDRSCHTLWERNNYEKFEEKEDKFL